MIILPRLYNRRLASAGDGIWGTLRKSVMPDRHIDEI